MQNRFSTLDREETPLRVRDLKHPTSDVQDIVESGCENISDKLQSAPKRGSSFTRIEVKDLDSRVNPDPDILFVVIFSIQGITSRALFTSIQDRNAFCENNLGDIVLIAFDYINIADLEFMLKLEN